VVAENVLLRHQLLVLSRPTRKRCRLAAHDQLVWLVARRLLRDWRRHLVLVRPEAVVRSAWTCVSPVPTGVARTTCAS
jgi:hypothetical protein